MSTSSILVPIDHHQAVGLLQPFFGQRAREIYESHGRSLAQLVAQAHQSAELRMRLLARAHTIALAAAAEQVTPQEEPSTSDALKRFLNLRLAGRQGESFVAVFLDAGHHLVAVEDIFGETLGRTDVNPREVAKAALRHKAVSVICSHSYPISGGPSVADKFLAHALRHALRRVDVRLLDHILIAGGAQVSFARLGLI